MKNYIGTIYAGSGGCWNFYINMHFDRNNDIEYNSFTHPSCVEEIFREIDTVQESGFSEQYPETDENAETKSNESADQHNDLLEGGI